MNVIGSNTQTTWLVEHNGLKYVRTYYHKNQDSALTIGWHNNFDYSKDIVDKIVSEVELEEMFSNMTIQRLKDNRAQSEVMDYDSSN